MKNKALLASAATLVILSAFLFAPVRSVAAAVVYSGMSIVNSVINSTPIGTTTPAAGAFTALGASSVTAGSMTSNFALVNGQPSSYAGANGFNSYGRNGTGDMDFVAANSGSSPSFYWYFLLGSTASAEMWLDQGAVLHVPDGIAANVSGALTGNGTGTWTGPVVGNASTATSAISATSATTAASTSGNSATASAFNHTPTPCTGNLFANGIAASGAANCANIYQQHGTVSVAAQDFTSSAVTFFTLSFTVSAPPAGSVVVCTPQSDLGDETQYSCWITGTTLFVKLTHSATGLPFTTNGVNLNYMVLQP